MNKLNLSDKWIKRCQDLPESGMGYQKVSCKVKQSDKEITVSGIVLNCSILETVISIQEENIIEIDLQ